MAWKLALLALLLAGCAQPGESNSESSTPEPLTISRCVTIQRGHDRDVVADTYIKPNALRVNFGAKPVFRVSASDEALLRFEIGSIPRSAVITKATLQLFANGEAGDGTIRVHRVTAPWAEADVTYASFKQSFASEPVAALRIERRTTQKSVDVASVVASWVSGAKPNYGLELDTGPDHHAKCDRPGDDDRDPTLFVSSEDVAAARRPALEVCYSTTVDECTANPCHNGGTCKNASSGYRCACAPGFSGPTCDKRLDPCLANPCQHGASCTSTPSSYACVCPAGFSGTHCETNTDDCASLPCQHGGVCSDGIASYSCACAPGYDGVNCEHALDNCADSPCHNGGACANLATRFACTCLSGFSGPTCDTNIDDCAGRPCVNGTCVDGVASFSCACGPDWGGARCDVNLNSCAQAPCLNGGTCTNAPGAYSCACARGYTGANCEIDVNDCAPNPCSNGGMCVDGIASYSCMCPAGYVGTNCETAVPAPERVRINGECFALCQSDSDPDGDGWGYEQDACVMPSNPLSTSSPWCDTPVSPAAYEAPHASVDDSTTSVATIPRPPRLEIAPPLDCPYASAGLLPWNPAWLTADGTIDLPAGVRVLVRGNDDIPSTTLVRHLHVPTTSELVFADQPATFRISDVLIDGALRLGSATCRLESAIRFEFDTDEDVSRPAVRSAIYDRMGLGIMVGPSGVLEMFGHLQQPTWTRLAATASAGNSQLLLAEAVDWQPGQQIVIATSARVDYPMHDGNELRTITRVQNGKTVLLDRPLDSPHYGGSEYQVEVGLLSHNLLFRTADRVLAAAPTFGGHIMVHSKNARVSGVELYGMGQQNFLARYPFHFHLAGDVAGAGYLTDSSIWRSNWRCAVVHRTDHAIVSRNVAYDNFGHCYYLEDGVEMNNELSFNLAVKTKIMGPTDQASIDAMRALGQPGFTLTQSPDLVQPADRAAAGFYISNGNNRIIGNAASGGFAGFSLPNLPRALGGSVDRIFPIQYGVSDFDGNTAHSAGYLWGDGACIYVGGTLLEVGGQLQYTSGRSTEWDLLRHQTEVFNNTKTFLCEQGITHWGNNPRIVNFEAWDNGLLGRLFGAASVQSALVVAQTGNSLPVARPISGFERGFQFYDTRNQTILKDVTFRGFHHDSYGDTWTDRLKEWDSCALLSMTHSDQYTPQNMNAVAGLHFVDVDDAQRICISDSGTLASRNFNLIDTDGSASRTVGDGLAPGPRLLGSAFASAWQLSSDCVRHDAWGARVCPLRSPQGIASIGVSPDADVRVKMYGLDNTSLGDNWYSSTDSIDAQISGPSGVGWHHAFPGGVPETFQVQVLQVPDASFVLLSFSLPPGVACAIHEAGWAVAPDVRALLVSPGPVYTTAEGTCFIRIPPTQLGNFEASGLAVPNMTWRGTPTPTTYFSVDTGCLASNPACQTISSTLPTMP